MICLDVPFRFEQLQTKSHENHDGNDEAQIKVGVTRLSHAFQGRLQILKFDRIGVHNDFILQSQAGCILLQNRIHRGHRLFRCLPTFSSNDCQRGLKLTILLTRRSNSQLKSKFLLAYWLFPLAIFPYMGTASSIRAYYVSVSLGLNFICCLEEEMSSFEFSAAVIADYSLSIEAFKYVPACFSILAVCSL